MNTRKGFTLIEVLVVVLIIGILTSLALPQYVRMVNKSRLAAVWQPMRMLQKAAMVCITDGQVPQGLDLNELKELDCMNGIPSESLAVRPQFNGIQSPTRWDYHIWPTGTVGLGYSDEFFIGITRNGIYWCADKNQKDCEKLNFTETPETGFRDKYFRDGDITLPTNIYRERKRD